MRRDDRVPPARQLTAIVLLPGTVTIVVPLLIIGGGRGPNVGWGLPAGFAALTVAAGAGLIAAGLALWIWTVRLFARIGRGTLAPWDPTQHLVTEGPYGYVRNPMITAVLAVLAGEAAVLGSPAVAVWSGAFFVLNALWFVVYEEPDLDRRFGDAYGEYRRHVPRWIPRRTRWSPGGRGQSPIQ